MFRALTIADIRAVMNAAAAVRRDDRAMQEYLHPGSTTPGSFHVTNPAQLHRDAEAGRFDSAERAHFKELIMALSPDAKLELIAVLLLGGERASDFADALESAKRIPPDYRVEYIGARSFLHLRKGLSELGIAI
jgi:hypothetical protein